MTLTTVLWGLLTLAQGVVIDQWEVKAPRHVMAAAGTCVRIPCSFSRPSGFWLKTVQWLKGDKTNGTLIVSSSESPNTLHHPRANIPEHWQSDKDCTLTIDSLTKRDEGRYYFRMENYQHEKYSGPEGVLLNISDESSLLTISAPEEITEGNAVVLTCSVKFACPGSLRWRGMDGLDLVPETESPGSAENSWTTSLTLSFVASYQDHGRSLRCVHSPGESAGKSITLIVNYAPRSVALTLSPFTLSPRVSPLSIRCTVGSSNPPVTSYWWHRTRSGSSLTTGTQKPTYDFQLFKDTDYWCEAVNSVGPTASEKTKLPVYGGSGWAVWTPVSVRARVGSCVTIPCRFRVPRDTRAPWTGIWLKDDNYSGTRVYTTSGDGEAEYKRRVHFLGSMEDQNCSLKIQNLESSDSGKYFFRLEGSDKWSDPIGVNLIVSGQLETPEIGDPGQVMDGREVSLTCSLHSYCADDVPLLIWQPLPLRPAVARVVYRDQHWVHSSEVEFMPRSDGPQRAVSCEATFPNGTSSARTARTLDVMYPPQNVTVSLKVNGRIDGSLNEGDRVLLSCSFTAANPPVQSYTWYRDGADTHRGSSRDLTFPSVSYAEFGKYACQATNAAGSSRSEEVTVTGEHKPQDVHIEANGVEVREKVSVNMYDRLSLACVSRVSDPPVSSYSWYRNDYTAYGYGGQTLVLNRITPQQAGRYRCTAENKMGTASSETVTVNVQYAPTNVRITAPTAPPAGKYITLRCESQASPAANSYSWTKLCGSQSTDLQKYGAEYRLWTTVEARTCEYFCTAKNPLGQKDSPAQRINVQYKPQDVHIEANGVEVREEVSVNMYDRLSLACVSRVSDPPVSSYSWYRYDYTAYGYGDQTLVLNRITPQQAGQYRCTAGNKMGTASSETVTVNVQYAPIDVRITAPTAPPAGEDITLRCESQANPVVNSYRWRMLCGSQSIDLRGDGAEYTLRATVEVGTCDYFCSARNSLGGTESPAQRIDVQYAPTEVRVVSEEDGAVEGEGMSLRCQARGNPPPGEYRWRRECSGMEERLGEREWLQVTSLRLDDQRCHYYCLAVNTIGQQESVGKRLRVVWSKQRKIIAGVTPILVLLILIIPLVFYIRHRRKKVDSQSSINTDATNVVYSVVKKSRKPCDVYENVWLTDPAHAHACRPEPQETFSYWQGATRDTGQTRVETARAVRQREPDVVYSQVRNRNAEPGGSEDYENVAGLWGHQEGESEGEGVEYTTIAHHLSPTS